MVDLLGPIARTLGVGLLNPRYETQENAQGD